MCDSGLLLACLEISFVSSFRLQDSVKLRRCSIGSAHDWSDIFAVSVRVVVAQTGKERKKVSTSAASIAKHAEAA